MVHSRKPTHAQHGKRSEDSVEPPPDASCHPNTLTQRAVDTLVGRDAAQQSKRENRRYERQIWQTDLDVTIEELWPTGASRRTVRVKRCDLSRGGFSFVFQQAVRPGARIRVCMETLPGKPVLTGTVCHCRHTSGAKHHIGVKFG